MKFEWFDNRSIGKGKTSDVKCNKCRVSFQKSGGDKRAVAFIFSKEFQDTIFKAEYVKIAIVDNNKIAIKRATGDENGRYKIARHNNQSTVCVKKTIKDDAELKKWEKLIGIYQLEQYKDDPNIFIGSDITFDWL